MKSIVGLVFLYSSLIFANKNEETNRKKWPSKKWILGHRGARAQAPENTLSAFRKAMDDGADGVEFDVFLSKDGVPVVIHDDTVDRTTDGHGAVCDLSAEEMACLNAAKNFSSFAKEGIPNLEQTLEILPKGAIANVELKGCGAFSRKDFVEKLIAVLEKHEMRLTIIISSFDGALLSLFRERKPDYLIALLLAVDDENWPNALCHLKRVRPNALHLPADLASAPILSLAKRKNLHVAIWTVNDLSEAKEWFARGVDGIFTDEVSKIVGQINS